MYVCDVHREWSVSPLQANLVQEKTAVFVCATSGQGDPPDNMLVGRRLFLMASSCVTFPWTHTFLEFNN